MGYPFCNGVICVMWGRGMKCVPRLNSLLEKWNPNSPIAMSSDGLTADFELRGNSC